METIIVFVDDAAHAREQLRQRPTAVDAAHAAPAGAVHWVLVACAPRMTHRISKWVSRSARENWRAKWFTKTQDQLLPLLAQGGNQVTALLAQGPLAEMARELKLRHGAASAVIDARRLKSGADFEPLAGVQAPPPPVAPSPSWKTPGALGSLGALLLLGLQFAE